MTNNSGSGWNVREDVKYVWTTPLECPLPKLTRTEVCSLISKVNLMIAGDLVHWQLHDLLLDFFHDGPTQCYGEQFCKKHFLCHVPSLFLGSERRGRPSLLPAMSPRDPRGKYSRFRI